MDHRPSLIEIRTSPRLYVRERERDRLSRQVLVKEWTAATLQDKKSCQGKQEWSNGLCKTSRDVKASENSGIDGSHLARCQD